MERVLAICRGEEYSDEDVLFMKHIAEHYGIENPPEDVQSLCTKILIRALPEGPRFEVFRQLVLSNLDDPEYIRNLCTIDEQFFDFCRMITVPVGRSGVDIGVWFYVSGELFKCLLYQWVVAFLFDANQELILPDMIDPEAIPEAMEVVQIIPRTPRPGFYTLLFEELPAYGELSSEGLMFVERYIGTPASLLDLRTPYEVGYRISNTRYELTPLFGNDPGGPPKSSTRLYRAPGPDIDIEDYDDLRVGVRNYPAGLRAYAQTPEFKNIILRIVRDFYENALAQQEDVLSTLTQDQRSACRQLWLMDLVQINWYVEIYYDWTEQTRAVAVYAQSINTL
jgi:hypothetical protein